MNQPAAASIHETETASAKQAEKTITLTANDLREIMGEFLNTLLHATSTNIPPKRIEASLDALVMSAERRSNKLSQKTSNTQRVITENKKKRIQQEPMEVTPSSFPQTLAEAVGLHTPLSPISPKKNLRDPRVRARTHST